jgi:hypothetical protein
MAMDRGGIPAACVDAEALQQGACSGKRALSLAVLAS